MNGCMIKVYDLRILCSTLHVHQLHLVPQLQKNDLRIFFSMDTLLYSTRTSTASCSLETKNGSKDILFYSTSTPTAYCSSIKKWYRPKTFYKWLYG